MESNFLIAQGISNAPGTRTIVKEEGSPPKSKKVSCAPATSLSAIGELKHDPTIATRTSLATGHPFNGFILFLHIIQNGQI
ncbi:Uncharacterised protein [Chlamydia trachomatis]|nr:Uncharacterised protein [Chlamydia trachomatis]